MDLCGPYRTSDASIKLSGRGSRFDIANDEALASNSPTRAPVRREKDHVVLGYSRETRLPSSRDSNTIDLHADRRADVHDDSGLTSPPSPPLSVYGINQIPLQNRLLSILRKIPGHEEKKGFFPEGELVDLLSEEHVTHELEQCFEDLTLSEIEVMAKRICQASSVNFGPRSGFKRVFAILVLCEKPEAITRFLAEDVSDRDLPLHKSYPSEKLPNFYDLVRQGQKSKLESFRGWSYTALWRFEEWQWTTIAPFFRRGCRKDVKHLELQDQVLLPFTQDSRFILDKSVYQRLEFEGGYSNVFKVDIHPDHHDLCEDNAAGRKFAIKCLLSRDQSEFKREVDTLTKFSGDTHKHLVSLLATYEQFGKFYLVFPWAEADLQGFWNNNPLPRIDHEGVMWVAEQCSGIAHGLTKIHHYETWRRTNSMNTDSKPGAATRQDHLREHAGRSTSMDIETRQMLTSRDDLKRRHFRKQLFGRHGDIKPENILWFRDPKNKDDRGVLKISDFGLTEFSTRHSLCYKRNSQIAHSPSYRPPECDLEGAVVGPSYDIWTLGCLYLELISWQLGGARLLREFRENRMTHDPLRLQSTDTFFEIVYCEGIDKLGAMVKPAVLDFVLGLHAQPACTAYFHDFLVLIMRDMLVVKSPNPREQSRLSIEMTHAKLLGMFEKCRNDAEYASDPSPWPRRRGDTKTMEEAVETNVAERPEQILRSQRLRHHKGKTLSRDG